MSDETIEVLKALGYPLSSVIVLGIAIYVARQAFQTLLGSVVQRDLEALKAENSRKLAEIQKEHNIVLEERKSELARETERLKSSLSTQAETFRLAAQKRFEILLGLWESSEALLKDTDFSSTDSIRASLSRIETSLADLRRYSVLMEPDVLEQVRIYLRETATVLTTSEEKLQDNSVDAEKQKNVDAAVSTALSFVPVVGGVIAALVPSIRQALEQNRAARAEHARAALEEALRRQFGVMTEERRPGGAFASGQLARGATDETAEGKDAPGT